MHQAPLSRPGITIYPVQPMTCVFRSGEGTCWETMVSRHWPSIPGISYRSRSIPLAQSYDWLYLQSMAMRARMAAGVK